MTRLASHRTGFTLIEVLVAMSLLGISLAALMGVIQICTRASHHACLLTKSVWLAERLLVDLRIEGVRAFELRQGEQSPFRWEVRIAPTTVEDLGAVQVRVVWQEQQRPQEYVLNGLVRMQPILGGGQT